MSDSTVQAAAAPEFDSVGTAAMPRRDTMAWWGIGLAAVAWFWIRQVYFPLSIPLAESASAGKNFGGLLLVVAALLLFFHGARRGRAGLGLMLAASIVCSMAVADYALAWYEATYQPEVAPFSWIAWAVARLAGEEATVQGGNLLFNDPQGGFTYVATWGMVGFRPLLLFWLGGGLLLAMRGRDLLPAFARLVFVPLLFFGLRYAYLVLKLSAADGALSSTAPPNIMVFWEPWSLIAVSLLSALLLAALDRPLVWAAPGPILVARRAALLALASGLFLGASFGWHDPGTTKPGRVLVDDRLTGYWEPAGRLLDFDRFGDFSTYSLAAMVEHLSRRFSVSVNGHRVYTREYLDDYDVLVLKTPEFALTPREIEDIHGWISAGGGLLVISDHTDLQGMSTHLNALVKPMGINFEFDATAEVTSGGFDYWSPGFLPEHPVSKGVGVFQCMTPCSIRLSRGAWPVMTMTMSRSTRGDYAGSSHFGGLGPDPSRAHGMLILSGAAQWDDGRVLAFSDSTVLSSFAYYMWSHSDYILRCVTWLNRERSGFYWLSWLFLLVAAVSFFWSLRGPVGGPGRTAAAALLWSVGAILGAKVTAELSASALTVPPPVADTVQVGLVEDGGYVRLPAVLGSQPQDLVEGENLMTFVQTPQRLGYETRVVARDPEVLEDLDILVLMNPDIEQARRNVAPIAGESEEAYQERIAAMVEELELRPKAEWVDAVKAWVRDGGRLIILDRAQHVEHGHSTAPAYMDENLNWQEVHPPLPTMGIRIADVGKGRVIYVAGSEEFDVRSMNHCMAYPGREERARYQIAYWIFGELAGIGQPMRQAYNPY